MLIKAGVDISRLKPKIRKKLNMIEVVLSKYGNTELVITSTYEGTHSAGSLHYANLAIDIRLPAAGGGVVRHLKAVLLDDYDVVLEHKHIHIEYDPK